MTVAAALPIPELPPILADPFLRVLHRMIDMRRRMVPSPTEVVELWMDSEDLARAIPSLKPEFIAALPEILRSEPATWLGSHHGANPPSIAWQKKITRDVLRYAEATDLHGYISTATTVLDKQAEQDRALYVPAPVPVSPTSWTLPSAPDPAAEAEQPAAEARHAPVYAKEELIVELEALDTRDLSTVKLAGLLRELNLAYTHEMPFACSALLRAVMDHVPPGFGFGGFAAVVSNRPSWTATEKKWLKGLTDFRIQGDDLMHRRMDKGRSWIDMDDMPRAAALNALLGGLLVELRKRPAGAPPAKPSAALGHLLAEGGPIVSGGYPTSPNTLRAVPLSTSSA